MSSQRLDNRWYPLTAPIVAPIYPAANILDSVENGEWRSVPNLGEERKRLSAYAAAIFRKDRRVNVRISSRDLDALQKRALEGGLPYQTLIASLIHKYVSGRL